MSMSPNISNLSNRPLQKEGITLRMETNRKIAMIAAWISGFAAVIGAGMIPNALTGASLAAGTVGLGAFLAAAPVTLWIGIAVLIIGLTGLGLSLAWAHKNSEPTVIEQVKKINQGIIMVIKANPNPSCFTPTVKRNLCTVGAVASGILAGSTLAAIAIPTVSFGALATAIGVSAVIVANPFTTGFIIGGLAVATVLVITTIGFAVLAGKYHAAQKAQNVLNTNNRRVRITDAHDPDTDSALKMSKEDSKQLKDALNADLTLTNEEQDQINSGANEIDGYAIERDGEFEDIVF